MSSYRDLIVWRTSMDLVDAVYEAVSPCPIVERFGLGAQMRAAAISIPSDIAEGHGRFHFRDFSRFLRTARGSLFELETQIIIGARRHYIDEIRAEKLLTSCAEIGRMINGLIRDFERRLAT